MERAAKCRYVAKLTDTGRPSWRCGATGSHGATAILASCSMPESPQSASCSQTTPRPVLLGDAAATPFSHSTGKSNRVSATRVKSRRTPWPLSGRRMAGAATKSPGNSKKISCPPTCGGKWRQPFQLVTRVSRRRGGHRGAEIKSETTSLLVLCVVFGSSRDPRKVEGEAAK